MNLMRVIVNDIAVYSIGGYMLWAAGYLLWQEVKDIVKEKDWSRLIIAIIVACIANTIALSMGLI